MWPFKRAGKPDEFPVSDLKFLGEQNGEPERRLKDQLIALLRQQPDVERAYLARAINAGRATVMLCVATRADEPDESLPPQIGKIFAGIFNANDHLDILFSDAAQEAQLAEVCAPFFNRSTINS